MHTALSRINVVGEREFISRHIIGILERDFNLDFLAAVDLDFFISVKNCFVLRRFAGVQETHVGNYAALEIKRMRERKR